MFPPLSSQDVFVWCVDLDRPAAVVEQLAGCLSSDERRRSQRFMREADRRRFLVSHAALRSILGIYLDVPGGDVEIALSPTGKPELASHLAQNGLQFNLSHSEEIALVAVSFNREVGIDVERIRPLGEMESIVERDFAAAERDAWLGLPDDQRIAAFFRCWTRKEAYLKARGVGLSLGLDQFEVSFSSDESVGIVRDVDANDAARQWRFYDVSPRENYLAACVTRPHAKTVQAFDWPLPPAIANS